jgi:integrase
LLFENVVEEWIRRDQSKNKPSSLYQVTRSLEVDLLPAWRGKRVDEIGKRDVIELLDNIADRGAPAMARRVQSHIRRFFRWCIERDILKIDPTQAMPRVGNGKSRDRVLTDEELTRVLTACSGPYRAVVRMLALTGARREEIAQLRWSEIDGNYHQARRLSHQDRRTAYDTIILGSSGTAEGPTAHRRVRVQRC